jgi:hypothetical protein
MVNRVESLGDIKGNHSGPTCELLLIEAYCHISDNREKRGDGAVASLVSVFGR